MLLEREAKASSPFSVSNRQSHSHSNEECLESVWLIAVHLLHSYISALSIGTNPELNPAPKDHAAAGNTYSQKGFKEKNAQFLHALPHVQDVTSSIKWVVTWSDHLHLEKSSGNLELLNPGSAQNLGDVTPRGLSTC